MENARKVEEQAAQVPVVPTIATTPFMPIIPTPVPIWTPEMANQFYSHSNGIPAGFDLPPFPEISNWPNHRLEPSPFAHHNAANRVQISFDSFPSSSNGIGIPQLLTQPDLPLAYSAVTNEGQFVPPYNSQFIPTTYTSFHHHQLLGVEQPFLNTIHNQYTELPGKSNNFFIYLASSSHFIKIFI
ncbi:hypothetical protein VIGAN_04340500 [Vigna angularis var. angularis]|uniref:Uncharacterized protein n=1 Tax=Vigna angularis var. angularis TaxID=157739 RepID=A0A0S3RZ13_PHAAN|nr:hypothetical protein VIGAN_04340500 [Vigna angularis var. angularis]